MLARETPKNGKIALPRRLASDEAHDVARQPIVVHPDTRQLRDLLLKQELLSLFGAIGLEGNQCHALRSCLGDECFDSPPRLRLEQRHVAHRVGGTETWMLPEDIRIEVSHHSIP